MNDCESLPLLVEGKPIDVVECHMEQLDLGEGSAVEPRRREGRIPEELLPSAQPKQICMNMSCYTNMSC